MATKVAKSLSTLGEFSNQGLNTSNAKYDAANATKVRGSERLLVIEELSLPDRKPTGVSFRFARENFSAPRGPQQFGLQLRTVRNDLPGAEEPVEQVLGWNYTAFTVTGVWDDRYAGKGYAEQTRRDFEDLVKRGNLIKYQFEQLSFYGLITNLGINYQRKDRQGYTFTISPHDRYKDETVRQEVNPSRRVVMDPKTSVALARRGLELIKADQALASLRAGAKVQSLLKSDAFSVIGAGINDVEVAIRKAETIVEKEILQPGQNVATTLNRGAQALAGAKTALSSILSQTRSMSVGAQMATSSFMENLKYENWKRSVSYGCSQAIVVTEQSRRDFFYRSKPKPTRLHRVRAGESLYQISNLYYNTPHHWREILIKNKLSNVFLYGGELIEIPELTL